MPGTVQEPVHLRRVQTGHHPVVQEWPLITCFWKNFRIGTCNFPFPQFSRTLEFLNGLISNLFILTPASYRIILEIFIFHTFEWIKINKISDP